MNQMIEVFKCEVCGNEKLFPVIDLGLHPLCDELIPVGSQSLCHYYPIKILYCKKCSTAIQRYQVPKINLFPQSYHYRSRFTADVLNGMKELVNSIEYYLGGLSDITVLDIGCNDGSLLDFFSSKGAKTIGVEPTDAFKDAEGRGHIILNKFFSYSVAKEIIKKNQQIDVVTFTNVFAHIENLPELLRAVDTVMSDNSILVVENHYMGSVLEKKQFDTFYHEHPRTYSINSFIHIAETLGRKVIDVQFPQRYGGNIRVVIGKAKDALSEANFNMKVKMQHESAFLEQFAQMRSFIDTWKSQKKAEILELVGTHGKLSAKAFPGRAAILVAMLGLTESEIEVVYEKPGSLKIGHYLPGTRIPIRSDEELFARIDQVEVLLNLAWHIPKEIEGYLCEHGFKGRIVHII
ncbi:class I SAM-dependent methyltransferase [Desulfonatronovibrio magnus]|uniref:class I SAM-dependent methyltransferase n=1 Tax=Desulfonatronovibrio magnus TaxID=698827 RepID=UPI000698D831|nr:class I SAM-dependent methyltransferase [Desulfonatronovibrio magnus]